jgi:hypothetical protein
MKGMMEEGELLADQSISVGVKQYFNDDMPNDKPHIFVDGGIASIVEIAHDRGLSLQQYVNENPDMAIRQAEATLAEWLKIQSTAAIEGQIVTSNGTFTLNRNMTKLIETRVNAAQEQLNHVNQLAFVAHTDGTKRKDLLIKALYNRAVYKGDVRAATYLIDRVEGRPGEAKTVDLDYDNAYNVYQIIHTLFDRQLEVLNSGNGTKLICCSRRSGKTHLLVAQCLIECLRIPNTASIYIGETMELTENLVDTAANQIVDKCHLRDKKGKRLQWRHLDNGSKILVRGLSNTKDPDQIRGNKAKIIVIDEFFHLKSELLEYMQREVLQPMQMDYADDYKFICAGTPPSIKGTYGEYAWKTWEVPHYFWTYKDNPHPTSVEARDQYVENVLKEKGLDWTSTYARREYGGEWIYDDDLLLYPEYHEYNPREGIPQFNIDQVLFGIDYGVSDNDTLIGIAWDNTQRRGYVFHEDKFNRLDIRDRTISQLAFLRGQVQVAWQKALEFFPHLTPREANKRIMWDADDNQQHITDDFNMNCRIPEIPELRLNIMNAHKTDKVMMFDKIRDLFRTASLLLIEGSKTSKECDQTVLKRGPNGQVYPEVDDKTFHPDLLPALRYALWNVIGQEAYKSEAERAERS